MKNPKNLFPDKQEVEHNKSNRSIFNPSIIEHRERLVAAKPMLNPANVPFLDILVPVQDDVKIPIRAYIPKSAKAPLPTIFYIPGTAFIATEVKFTHVICSHLAAMTKSQVIVINHRLAPENQFPKGYQDTYDVFKFFVVEMPEHYLIDKKKLAIVGYSSGGNFAASMALQAKKDGIAITQQVLVSPIVDLSRTLKGFEEFEKQDKAISEEFVNFFLKLYIPDNVNPKDPKLSPFWENSQDIKGLPRTAIMLAKYDRFRSDAESYYEKLKFAGVEVEKFVAAAEDHSYLWYKLEVVEKIAEIINFAFRVESIHSLHGRHTIFNITPRLMPNKSNDEEKNNDEKKENSDLPRAKL